jgi:hypothetical protein
MTINEAMRTVINQLEEVRLPIRDQDNIGRISNALGLMYSLETWAQENVTDTPDKPAETEEG